MLTTSALLRIATSVSAGIWFSWIIELDCGTHNTKLPKPVTIPDDLA
jgi:hypothetical protein